MDNDQATSLPKVRSGLKTQLLVPCPLPSHFLYLHISITLSFLIDADVNLIDQDKAEQANIPIKTLAETKIILGLDNKVLA